MSFFSVIGRIGSLVGKVSGIVSAVVKVAGPLLDALRPAVNEVDVALSWLEENAAEVGDGADEFLDRNLPTVNAIEEVAGRGVVVFSSLERVAVMCREFSQEQTPDTITAEEAEALVAEFKALRDNLRGWGPAMDKVAAMIEAAEG